METRQHGLCTWKAVSFLKKFISLPQTTGVRGCSLMSSFSAPPPSTEGEVSDAAHTYLYLLALSMFSDEGCPICNSDTGESFFDALLLPSLVQPLLNADH